MSYASGNFKIKLNVNALGFGGHEFYTKQSVVKDGIWGQIWTGDYSDESNPFGIEKLPAIHSILLWYPESKKFEPNKKYITKAFIRSYENIEKNFYPGAKFEIRTGQLYDNKYWATGEVLEILDDKENDNKK